MGKDKKIALITGATGMVGSHLADFLLENTDWKVVGISRWRSPLDNVEHLLSEANDSSSRFKLLNGDINDAFSMIKLISQINPDYIFHLAAQSFPRTSFDSPIDTLSTNIIGTANILEAVRVSKVSPIIHVCSSSEVFGRVPKDRVPITENESFHPASPYAISKAGTDLLGRFYGEAYGINVCTTRMFTHTGPRRGDVFAESSFAKQIAMAELGLIDPIVKVGNLSSKRTIADVRDAVRAYYLLVTISPEAGSFYNIGGSYTCTVGEVLEHLMGLSHLKNISYSVETERLRPIDADLQIPDTSLFRDKTGWTPKISFEQTMTDLLDYWRQKVSKNPGQMVR